ncbi:hypothetical protein E2C01_101676 [Portunus trituberculatus]|uniref:Uncharacterized protein n=1 Tax=Portunus trituberculatus TaxID=210409 RepID=A0A5B7KGG6_PORTR|nr:hypothetical protein [Portunus trituberculatus]
MAKGRKEGGGKRRGEVRKKAAVLLHVGRRMGRSGWKWEEEEEEEEEAAWTGWAADRRSQPEVLK